MTCSMGPTTSGSNNRPLNGLTSAMRLLLTPGAVSECYHIDTFKRSLGILLCLLTVLNNGLKYFETK